MTGEYEPDGLPTSRQLTYSNDDGSQTIKFYRDGSLVSINNWISGDFQIFVEYWNPTENFRRITLYRNKISEGVGFDEKGEPDYFETYDEARGRGEGFKLVD